MEKFSLQNMDFRDPRFSVISHFGDQRQEERKQISIKSHATDGNLRRNNRSILKELQLYDSQKNSSKDF